MKILIFEPNWMGDIIFTTPVFESLKKSFKNCFLGCVVPRRYAAIIRHNPFIDEIIEFNERTTHRSLVKKIVFIHTLRKKQYDTVLLLHRSFTRALICYLAGIEERIGMAFRKRSFLLTKKVAVIEKDSLHKQDYYLKAVEPLGIHIQDKNCRVYLSPAQRQWAQQLVAHNTTPKEVLIALSITTNWAPKNWPKKHFAELVAILRTRLKNVKFFVTSPSEEKELYHLLDAADAASIIDMSAKMSLRELAALYEKMDLVIAGDSGPLHLAGALNTHYIGIFGATSPALTVPRSQRKGIVIFKNECPTPCYQAHCTKDFVCMENVTPQEVADAAHRLLDK